MSVKHVLGRIRKADLDFNLMQEGDRIAVGVSGGKDSMLLLYCLALYRNIALRHMDKKIEIVGIHIKMGFPNMDFSEVIEFCKEHDIEFHTIDSKIYDILKIQANDDGTLKCSICSKLKKGAVINEAKKLNCNKTAFAHHADDAIETLFLNAIFGGRLATFAPKMFLTNSEMTFIRPFVYSFESDIVQAYKEAGIPIVKSTCPMDGHTKRQDMKELLNFIYKTYPSSKENFLLMLHNQKQLSLWVKQSDIDEQD
ncbi:tRNA 2-thiocytidine biosynthesis TtcA family protein [Anaerorhabdus sp.]|uniref:tRNA 2-thiocytidine biosynthesis TtcA family protein n=1 Tax=Anaerorhabdus sp. TaxID=1872524 RepID=UPI002FC76329